MLSRKELGRNCFLQEIQAPLFGQKFEDFSRYCIGFPFKQIHCYRKCFDCHFDLNACAARKVQMYILDTFSNKMVQFMILDILQPGTYTFQLIDSSLLTVSLNLFPGPRHEISLSSRSDFSSLPSQFLPRTTNVSVNNCSFSLASCISQMKRLRGLWASRFLLFRHCREQISVQLADLTHVQIRRSISKYSRLSILHISRVICPTRSEKAG